MKQIKYTYRQWGSYAQYIETGSYEADEFGDLKWKRHGYPKDDSRLTVKFEVHGAWGKNSTESTVKILVPDDYPLVIRATGSGKQSGRDKPVELFTPTPDEDPLIALVKGVVGLTAQLLNGFEMTPEGVEKIVLAKANLDSIIEAIAETPELAGEFRGLMEERTAPRLSIGVERDDNDKTRLGK